MKRNYIPFVAGIVTTILLIGLVGATLATQESGGQGAVRVTEAAHPAVQTAEQLSGVYAGQAGVALFGREKVAPGAKRTTGQGTEVPAVLTYMDGAGYANYYVSAETVRELLDVAYGVTWNEELQCVDFGSEVLTDGENAIRFTAEGDDYNVTEITVGDTSRVMVGHNRSSVTTVNGVTVQTGDVNDTSPRDLSEETAARAAAQVEKKRATATAAEYGVRRGIFTEIDPAQVDLSTLRGYFMDQNAYSSTLGELEQTLSFYPMEGDCAVVTIENTSGEDILVRIARPCTVGVDDSADLCFSKVRIPAGKSLMRAFSMTEADGAFLQNKLLVHMETLDGSPVSVRLTSEQYGT